MTKSFIICPYVIAKLKLQLAYFGFLNIMQIISFQIRGRGRYELFKQFLEGLERQDKKG